MTNLEFDELINKNIDEDVFSSRAVIWLERAEKTRIIDLVTMTKSELYSIKNITQRAAEHTISKLKQLGLSLRPERMSESEWIEHLKEECCRSKGVQEQQINKEDLIAKLIEVWDEKIEQEVKELIDRNI